MNKENNVPVEIEILYDLMMRLHVYSLKLLKYVEVIITYNNYFPGLKSYWGNTPTLPIITPDIGSDQ